MSREKDRQNGVPIETFYSENKSKLKLKRVSGKGNVQKRIVERDLYRPGLALTGFVEQYAFERIQVCGNTEMAYLKGISSEAREKILSEVFRFDIPCFVITDGKEPPADFIRLADANGISVFTTPLDATKAIQEISSYLEEKFAPRTVIHGSLVDVYGIDELLNVVP